MTTPESTRRLPWHPLRLGLPVLLAFALSACQTMPGARTGAQGASTTAAGNLGTAKPAHADPVRTVNPSREASDLRVFLADTRSHPGWTPVPLKPSGLLYVRTDAIIGRDDLMGIQSATDQNGGGILVLVLKDSGLTKLRDATAANPGMRLALVVGQMMLAAPAYASPIREQKLAFGVGSAHNADVAARSVAGVP
ncbi:hypothetical protein [Castellaniella sp.]|uniref:hypothetical protein n=1 Tax=Castellaniella sp. TaxID=1955812 RepID=UPI002AFFADDA|nr:hypothetical protein [Castellaniella sp.]